MPTPATQSDGAAPSKMSAAWTSNDDVEMMGAIGPSFSDMPEKPTATKQHTSKSRTFVRFVNTICECVLGYVFWTTIEEFVFEINSGQDQMSGFPDSLWFMAFLFFGPILALIPVPH